MLDLSFIFSFPNGPSGIQTDILIRALKAVMFIPPCDGVRPLAIDSGLRSRFPHWKAVLAESLSGPTVFRCPPSTNILNHLWLGMSNWAVEDLRRPPPPSPKAPPTKKRIALCSTHSKITKSNLGCFASRRMTSSKEEHCLHPEG